MDDADRTLADLERMDEAEERARAKLPVYQIPAGVPGDCDLCGEWFGRLIRGACVACRKKYHLP